MKCWFELPNTRIPKYRKSKFLEREKEGNTQKGEGKSETTSEETVPHKLLENLIYIARLPFDLDRALPLNPVFDGAVENCCVHVRGEESWQGKNS
ncbi:hypothetical protein COLO4_04229 [Corchorus olitorius]|uniref:Uncharacterized protein n=1 Tax=Corchorus olitorius TaxID=93759 RepID=A0A1R3KUX7_9ROSI|nr:hypothetical protein COLO4_04229 [Corchorus olitorius]